MTLLRTLLFVLAMGGVVWAQTESQPIPWQQLNQQDQQILQRFSDRWDELPADRQQRLLNGARQWANMNQEERQQAQQRFQQWRQLPPDQQQRLRERFQRFRQLPPEQREAIRNARQWFQTLPPERRKEMREKWRNMSPDERRAFRRQLRKEYGEQQPHPGGNRPAHPRSFRPGQ
jgi:CHASE3 domain sensor protein